MNAATPISSSTRPDMGMVYGCVGILAAAGDSWSWTDSGPCLVRPPVVFPFTTC